MVQNQGERDSAMYRNILVPIDLADQELAKPAVATALMMAGPSDGSVRFVNVLPLTPVMLAEYVPPDFEVQQRKAAEDALAIVVKETGLTFGRWRQQLHLIVAIRELASGASVQRVSADLGYESVTAFITMFKKALGRPPAKYLSSVAQESWSHSPVDQPPRPSNDRRQAPVRGGSIAARQRCL